MGPWPLRGLWLSCIPFHQALLFPEWGVQLCAPEPEPSLLPATTQEGHTHTPQRHPAQPFTTPSLHFLPPPRPRQPLRLSSCRTLTPPIPPPRPQESACSKPDEDILDIPLDDPGANAAAAKIQASFRGHMARKKIKSRESGRKGPGPGGPGGAGGARGGSGSGPSGD